MINSFYIFLLMLQLHNDFKLSLLHYSICKVESNYKNVKIVDRNNRGSYGVCQVQLALAQSIMKDPHLTKQDLMNVEKNIQVSGKYIDYLKNVCYNNIKCIINKYSVGETKKYYNKKYVTKVLQHYRFKDSEVL